jgi:hypothetical protein
MDGSAQPRGTATAVWGGIGLIIGLLLNDLVIGLVAGIVVGLIVDRMTSSDAS